MSLMIEIFKAARDKNKVVAIPVQSEYTTVLNAMTVKPSSADQTIQNKWVYDLKQLGVWDKAIVLDNFATPTSQASLLNWKSPGTFNPLLLNAPAFTSYKGFKGNSVGNKMIDLNFTPSVNGAGFLGQDDITIIVGVQDNVLTDANEDVGSAYVGKIILYCSHNGVFYTDLNSADGSGLQVVSSFTNKYFAISRNTGAIVKAFKNLASHPVTLTSTVLSATKLYTLGARPNTANNKGESFLLIFKSLSETEVQGAMKSCDDYLKNYNNHIMRFQRIIDFNVVTEGHSFLSTPSCLPDLLEGKINTVKFYGSAVDGSGIANCVTREATVDSKLIVETSTYKNILPIWIGVNDFANNVGGGAWAYGNLKTYIQARIAAGWKLFVYTITPSTSGGRSAVFESERNIFNGLLRTDLSILANVYILDTDTIAELDDPSNTTYYVDALHPTLAGHLLSSQLFTNKITQLYE